MQTKGIHCLIVTAVLSFSGIAQAALVSSLQFKDPVGTVSPTETIDIWVTLSVSEDSDPLVIDPGLGYSFGLPASLMPSMGVSSHGYVPFASYTDINRAAGVRCTYSSMERCFGGAEYELHFNRGADSFITDPDAPFVMSAGESQDFLLFSLVPLGAVATGEYSLFEVSLSIHVYGFDAAGNELMASSPIVTTCPGGSCSFTRTVSEVPIPAAGILFAGALGLFGTLRTMRRR